MADDDKPERAPFGGAPTSRESAADAKRKATAHADAPQQTPSPQSTFDQDFAKVPELPAPTMPKGGGALRGIGEKFQMAAFTGTGNMSVPLALSPGRSGMGPSVSLAYDSGAGNAAFGIGWSLSIPSIRRRTDKGLPQYFDAGETDVFLLSGAEDLVPFLVESSGTWSRLSVTPRNGETIERFRPRVEGLFARIERHTVTATGNVYWVSVTKDNVTSIYGRNTQARVADPNNSTRIFEWLLEATYDDRGNIVYYEYKTEDLGNVTPSGYEIHRTTSSVSAQRYIKRIHYGNMTPQIGPDLTDTQIQSNTWLFEAVFDYGEHDATTPTPIEVNTWLARQDPFSTYKPCFEVRTYRLCQRVLMFHTFTELGTDPVLVRSTDFTYSENPNITYLTEVTQKGYILSSGTYSSNSLPPVDFTYQLPPIGSTVQYADSQTRKTMPGSVDGKSTRWVDLDGEGIAGLLTDEAGGSLTYRRNLGGAALSPPLTLVKRPSVTLLADGRQQLLDLQNEGHLELVDFSGAAKGFYDRTRDRSWGRFIPFKALPILDWNDPNVQFLDINGDGFADILRTEGNRIVWYPSLGRDGFDAGIILPVSPNERKGACVVFNDKEQCVHVADMSGDGLSDIVRVRNGEVSYWPNLGYGKFGGKVTMTKAPWFDNPDLFDPNRVRLNDVDGSGTTDIGYVGRKGITLWLNQAGNSFSDAIPILEALPTHDLASITFADFLGTGTACLVWFSTAPTDQASRLRYIDLYASIKPHLLSVVDNNMGLTTTLTYASSTKFYLQDRAAGIEWVTRLSFPVQVVERVEVYEAVTKQRFISTYSYRHGYYDGPEREFRGFGYVEQSDAESYSDDVGSGTFPTSVPPALPIVDGEFQLPPVVIKTWFHTGAWKDNADIAAAFTPEYYQGDSSATVLPRTLMLDFTPGTPQEAREAARALKGSTLRQEIYAQDGTSLASDPFSVAERSYAIRQLQPQGGNGIPTRYGVYFAHAREVVDYHYERDASDPRVQHAFTLAVDDFGTVTQAAAVGYPRRSSSTYAEQNKLWVTLAEKDVINVDTQDTWYRIGALQESRSFELTGITPPTSPAVLAFSDVATAASSATEISYETAPTSGYQKRLLKQAQAYYYSDDLSTTLSLGTIESRALIHHTQSLALTGGIVSAVYDTSIVTSTLLTTECGFLAVTSDYWATSSVPTYDASNFYLVTAVTEPFGNTSHVVFDSYNLLPTEAHTSQTTTPIDFDLVTTFDNDYRVLGPYETTDPNANRIAVAYDELGMVITLALMGKSGAGEGDTLSDPTAYFEYDLTSWATTKGSSLPTPNYAHTFHRINHGGTAVWQESLSYTAGNGKEVLRKVQAAPDPITSAARWVGNGRTVWDNKGNPIKQYEPYFSSSSDYDLESSLASSGVTPIMRYDALSRLIRTDFPNGTFSTVFFDPWEQDTWDPNDNVLASQWYATNIAIGSGPLYRAATLAAAHDSTPTLAYADTLGRTFLTRQDNGTSSSHVYYDTTLTLDVEGNTLSVTDARANTTLAHTYCPTGAAIQSVSAEAGTSQALYSTSNEALRSWNSNNVAVRHGFDVLRRVTHLYVKIGAGTEFLAEFTVYGEMLSSGATVNMLGRVYHVYDGAGVATNDHFDFKGNLLSSSRVLGITYSSTIDWIALDTLTSLSSIESTAASQLLTETFTTTKTYDALNRVTSITTPDTSIYTPTYNEANQLEAVDVNILGSGTATNFVHHIEYNARGQRIEIDYAGTSPAFSTTYTYEAETFRLSNQETIRASDSKVLQDATLTYDPVGNIVEIDDGADQTAFFNWTTTPPVSTGGLYEYDAIYRLTSSTGREHPGQTQPEGSDSPLAAVPHPNDTAAVRSYTESFEYDEVGNILQMFHNAGSGFTWTRNYTYDSSSNKLETSEMPGDPSGGPYTGTYTHDNRGNMTAMPSLSSIGWDWADRMQTANLGGGGNVYFTYDSGGNRVRKVWDKTSSLRDERIYLGNYELWRESTVSGGTPTIEEERQTVHVLDDVRRIAMIETLTVHSGSPVSSPTPRQRFQIANQLESAVVELTETGAIISYEEYFAFGMTSFHSANGSIDVSARRYRYNGKERDEETGLYYYGARYYAAWLGRWTAVDPSGADGPNRYSYVRNCPIHLHDPNGHAGVSFDPETQARLTEFNAAKAGQVSLTGKIDVANDVAKAGLVIPESVKRDFTASMSSVHLTPKAPVEKYTPQTPLGHATQAYAQAKAGDYGGAAESLAGGAAQIVTAPITAPFKAIGSSITAGPDIYAAYQVGGWKGALESYGSHFPVVGPALGAVNASEVKTTSSVETAAKQGDIVGFAGQATVDWVAVVAGVREAVPETSGRIGLTFLSTEEGSSLARPFYAPKSITRPPSGRTVFQGLEVRGMRDLSHISESTLRAQADIGFASKDAQGRPLQLHHLGQNPAGPVVEIPGSKHNIHNRTQHPLGNVSGSGLTPQERADFNVWRENYWKARAQGELQRRGRPFQ